MTSSRYLHSIILYLRYSVPILLLFFLSSNVLGISVPAPQGNINDFAGVLSKEWKTTLTELTHQIEQNTSVQVAVVIINSLGDVDKESYALAIGEQWGVGQKNKDNGIVFLIALQERESRIESGKGLEGTLNDAKVGRIARTYLVSAFKREEYGQGIYDTLEAIRNVISQEPDTPLASEDTSGIIHLILLGWLVLVIILASVQRDISLTKRYTRFGLGSGMAACTSGALRPGRRRTVRAPPPPIGGRRARAGSMPRVWRPGTPRASRAPRPAPASRGRG